MAKPKNKARIEQAFNDRLELYDAVPSSVIRAKLLPLLMNEDEKATVRLNAAKLLVEMLDASGGGPDETVKDLFEALKRDENS